MPPTVRPSTGTLVIPITRSGQWWTLHGIVYVADRRSGSPANRRPARPMLRLAVEQPSTEARDARTDLDTAILGLGLIALVVASHGPCSRRWLSAAARPCPGAGPAARGRPASPGLILTAPGADGPTSGRLPRRAARPRCRRRAGCARGADRRPHARRGRRRVLLRARADARRTVHLRWGRLHDPDRGGPGHGPLLPRVSSGGIGRTPVPERPRSDAPPVPTVQRVRRASFDARPADCLIRHDRREPLPDRRRTLRDAAAALTARRVHVSACADRSKPACMTLDLPSRWRHTWIRRRGCSRVLGLMLESPPRLACSG